MGTDKTGSMTTGAKILSGEREREEREPEETKERGESGGEGGKKDGPRVGGSVNCGGALSPEARGTGGPMEDPARQVLDEGSWEPRNC